MKNTQLPSNDTPKNPRKPWRAIVLEVLASLGRERAQVPLGDIYAAVERHPDAIARMAFTRTLRPKVRQVLNRLCDDGRISRLDRAVYGLPPNL